MRNLFSRNPVLRLNFSSQVLNESWELDPSLQVYLTKAVLRKHLLLRLSIDK